jgi:hypothetical protein
MRLGSGRARRRAGAAAALLVALGTAFGVPVPAGAAAAPGKRPNLVKGSAYLASPANLIRGHFYESFPGYADFGLTIDGAFALAATGDDGKALQGIVAFLDSDGKDPSGQTVNDWTGIGTRYASGGAVGKEALLAEIVGANPRHFGGRNLIAALDSLVCKRASSGTGGACAGAGNYAYGTSVFDQALGIMAQLRAGQRKQAASPVAYLESLRNADGSFPSLIPDSRDHDVDSTAMAVMALALAGGAKAAADVDSGVAWIAGRQQRNGGFPSAAGESINSSALAIQALTLKAADYRSRIFAAESFLASEQNADGGFRAYATGSRASNLRASTQAVGGAVGTSFGRLHRHVHIGPAHGGTGQPSPPAASSPVPVVEITVTKPAVTVTITVTATPSPSPSSALLPSVTPARSATSAPARLAAAGSESGLTTALWLASLAVAVAGAVATGLLLVRRRRLLPPGGGSAGGGSAGGGSAGGGSANGASS